MQSKGVNRAHVGGVLLLIVRFLNVIFHDLGRSKFLRKELLEDGGQPDLLGLPMLTDRVDYLIARQEPGRCLYDSAEFIYGTSCDSRHQCKLRSKTHFSLQF